MANSCWNKLTITGPEADLRAFEELARKDDEPLVINNFVPMPEELRETEAPNQDPELAEKMRQAHGAADWYEWAFANWGTKWDAHEVRMSKVTECILEYEFTTAWAPFKESVLKTMSEKFSSLHLELSYEEPSMAFAGHCVAQAGKILGSGSHQMKSDVEPD